MLYEDLYNKCKKLSKLCLADYYDNATYQVDYRQIVKDRKKVEALAWRLKGKNITGSSLSGRLEVSDNDFEFTPSQYGAMEIWFQFNSLLSHFFAKEELEHQAQKEASNEI
jgi:hypothetical protein